jgi:hypothetical protein
VRRPIAFAVVLAAGTLGISGLAAVEASHEGPSAESIFADTTNETSKAELQAEDDALRLLGEQNAAPVPDDPEEAGPPADPRDFTYVTDVLDDVEFPPSMGYSFVNGWQGGVGRWIVTLYAGSLTHRPEQGIVLLQLRDAETWRGRFAGPFEAPVEGPLRVESFNGSIISLSGRGQSVTFNAATYEFG